MQIRYLLYICLVFCHVATGDTLTTSGSCSPIITGTINGGLTLECKNRSGKILYSIGVSNKKNDEFNNNPLKYYAIYKKNTVEIHPNLEDYPIYEWYYNDMLSGYFIYPALDVKISNNTNNTIIIDRGIINVNNSRIYSRPYIESSQGPCGSTKLNFGNWGNEDAMNVSYVFNVKKVNVSSPDYNFSYGINDKFKHKIRFNVPKGKLTTIDMYEVLAKEGVNFHSITKKEWIDYQELLQSEKHINCFNNEDDCPGKQERLIEKVESTVDLAGFGSLKNGKHKNALTYGYIEYEYYDRFKSSRVKYKNKLSSLFELSLFTGCGDSLEITKRYDYKLKNSGDNYKVNLDDISHVIKPGEADRFTMILSATQATFHTFEINFHTVEHGYLPSKKIKLFIPHFKNWTGS